MAVNSAGSYSSLKSPRSPRQLPQVPSSHCQSAPHRSPIKSVHNNNACKSPSTPRVFEFPPEYDPESWKQANFDLNVLLAKSETTSVDSRSSLIPGSNVTGSTSNVSNNSSIYRDCHNHQVKYSLRNSPELARQSSPIFQFCSPKKKLNAKCPMSAGAIGRSRSPAFFHTKTHPKSIDRARRNSCFSLGPIGTPMSPTTIVTAPEESSKLQRAADNSSPNNNNDDNYHDDDYEIDDDDNDDDDDDNNDDDDNDAATKSSSYFDLSEKQTFRESTSSAQIFDKSSGMRPERNRDFAKRSRSDRMGSMNLNKSHGSLVNTVPIGDEKHGISGENHRTLGAKCHPRNVARKSTSDLTEFDAEDGETEVTILSSPRRRGSMKGGLAYLASRRGSRDSQISNISNVSNEDVGPLNFSAHPRGRQRRTSNFLELPVPDHIRPRVHSLPEKAYNPRAGDDLYRLRAFSITHKGIVNRGDSIISRRSRSNTSVNSSRNSNVSGERSPFEGSCCSGQGVAGDSSESEIEEIPKYRVVLLGDSGVGKTALVSQFMTSEYMNTYDASLDDEFGEKTVSILLDGEESDMIFIDHPHVEMSVENSLSTYEPHGCVVVYSVESRASFQIAEEMLNYLWREHYTQERSVIVVGNKSDLERSRTVEANEGKQLATSRECKFIETSSGIQHNVDELLVGILKQIRLREMRDKKLRRQGSKGKILSKIHGSKTALSLNLAREILNKMCLNDSKSKSCENLHVL